MNNKREREEKGSLVCLRSGSRAWLAREQEEALERRRENVSQLALEDVVGMEGGVWQSAQHLSPILRYADGHPTFLVLLDAHAATRLLDLLHLLLEEHELAVAQALRRHELAVRAPLAPRQLELEIADLGADGSLAARVRPVPAVVVVLGRHEGERADGHLGRHLPGPGVDDDGAAVAGRGRGRASRRRDVSDDRLVDDLYVGRRRGVAHEDG